MAQHAPFAEIRSRIRAERLPFNPKPDQFRNETKAGAGLNGDLEMEKAGNGSGGDEPRQTRGYDVGYGKPPVHTRFKKGSPSPNPTGRPKKQKSLVDSLGEALSREVVIRVGGRRVRRSLREITAHQLATKMAEGDLAAIKFAAPLDPQFNPAPEDDEHMIIELDLDDNHPRDVPW